MLLIGGYETYKADYILIYHTTDRSKEIRVCLKDRVVAAYTETRSGDSFNLVDEYCYGTKEAKTIFQFIKNGESGFNSRKLKGRFVNCSRGTLVRKDFILKNTAYTVDKYGRNLYACEITMDNGNVIALNTKSLTKEQLRLSKVELPYIRLTNTKIKAVDTEEPPIRTLEEISLFKDTSWLKSKKYYVVNNDDEAERLLTLLDTYKGPIAYDTETTGLRINMFSKINGEYAKKLHEANTDNRVRVDSLVGVIFCVEPDVSYYLPCGNKKFRNLYSDGTIRDKLINNYKAYYTVGAGKDSTKDIADYWRNTKANDITSDCILMERCRNILENGYIVCHNGTFDWKVAYCYDIDTNLSDDTMIMHQLMYKYRNTTSNKGESSALKHLALTEFGIDQLSLEDFFVGYSEKDDKGRLTAKKAKIDFSFMEYDGVKAYGPADGDMTLSLFLKYKKDMLENFKDLEFIYGIELLVSCAIGYMEFYGHRIDEHKIADVREEKELELLSLESEIRGLAGLRNKREEELYLELRDIIKERLEKVSKYNELYDVVESKKHSLRYDTDKSDELKELETELAELKAVVTDVKTRAAATSTALKNSMEAKLNLSASGQVADLFYNKLGIDYVGDKPSVGKNSLKPLLQEVDNETGEPKYPIIHKYREWKDTQSLITKFFGSLPDFMYPGGFIFSHYGQIQAATGRMSCSRPNAQQYCKAVTKIVVPRGNNIFFDADYSQIEYRTLVALADEKGLKEVFKDPDSDYHTSMASLMFDIPYEQVDKKSRSAAKSFNFGIPYGMGFKSLAILLHGNSNPESVADAKEKYELYFKNQPNVRKFFNKVKESALINRKTETLWKRKRFYTFTDENGEENNAKKASALRQAGNAVIQGTAADIFKISVARNWQWIRSNDLYGKVIIVNMIHDEQLIEIDCDCINVLRAFADIVENMQFKVENFPPLYVGGGIGYNWNYAKGGDAEVHPILAQAFIEKAKNYSLFNKPTDRRVWFEFFDKNVRDFRRNKVKSYITNSDNYGKAIHPAVLSLLNSDFTYGLKKTADESDAEYMEKLFNQFAEKNNIEADYSNFKAVNELMEKDVEEDKEYFDDEDMDSLIGDSFMETEIEEFELLSEKESLYGIKIEDLIKQFGVYVSKAQKICGVDMSLVNWSNKENFIKYITSTETDDESGMDFCLLDKLGGLHRQYKVNATGKGITDSLGIKSVLYT